MSGLFQRALKAGAQALALVPWLTLLGLGGVVFFAMPWIYRYSAPVILGFGLALLALTVTLASRWRAPAWAGPRNARAWLFGIVAAGLGLRLLYVLAVPPVQMSDSQVFSALARLVLDGAPYQEAYGVYQLRAYRPPGLPLLLAATMGLVGDHGWTPALLNCVCYGLSSLLVFDITRRLAGQGSALLAVAGLALWPSGVMISGRALTEWPSLLLLTLTAWAFLRGREEGRARWWLLAGVAMGFGALVRPQMMLVPGGLAVLALFEQRRWPRFRFALLAGVVAALCVLPWSLRNHAVLDAWVPISSGGGSNFYRANNGMATGGFAPYGEQSFDHLLPDEVAWSKANMQAGVSWVRDNPLRFIRLGLRKSMLTMGEDAEGAILSLKRAHAMSGPLLNLAIWLCNLWWLAVWVLALIAVHRHRASLRTQAWGVMLMWLTVFLPLAHAVFEAQPRYHMPMVGLLLVLMGMSIGVPEAPTQSPGGRERP